MCRIRLGPFPEHGIDRWARQPRCPSNGETLRQAIRKSDATLYRIAKDAEIDWSVLQRIMDGTRPNIRIDTVEKFCAYLGLELRTITGKRRDKPSQRRGVRSAKE